MQAGRTRSMLGGSLLAMAVVGCESDVSIDPEENDPSIACDGTLGQAPRVLVGELAAGSLHVGGGFLIHVETVTGHVRRIDACSGATETLAEVGLVSSAAIRGDLVYLVESSDAQPATLLRVPIAGGDVTHVADLPFDSRIVAHDSGVYVLAPFDGEVEGEAVYVVDEATESVALVQVLETWAPGTYISLIGVSDAGVYVRESYDCGCNPGLDLVAFDGSGVAGVPGTAGVLSVAAVGSDLFVATDLEALGFGSMLLDVVRLPLEGGEPEILTAADEALTMDVRRIAANEQTVCWVTYGGAPRCVDRASREVRLLDDDEAAHGLAALAMTDDAAYWLRATNEEETSFELVAAAP